MADYALFMRVTNSEISFLKNKKKMLQWFFFTVPMLLEDMECLTILGDSFKFSQIFIDLEESVILKIVELRFLYVNGVDGKKNIGL